jgi:hypothetical protein
VNDPADAHATTALFFCAAQIHYALKFHDLARKEIMIMTRDAYNTGAGSVQDSRALSFLLLRQWHSSSISKLPLIPRPELRAHLHLDHWRRERRLRHEPKLIIPDEYTSEREERHVDFMVIIRADFTIW